jgi:hypothetical protein
VKIASVAIQIGLRFKRVADEISNPIDKLDGSFAIDAPQGIGEDLSGNGDKTALAIRAVQPVGQFHRGSAVPCLWQSAAAMTGGFLDVTIPGKREDDEMRRRCITLFTESYYLPVKRGLRFSL